MKTSNIIILIVFAIQDRKVLIKAQSYYPTLLPGPYAYVKEFDPLTIEYTGDGEVIFRAGFTLNDVEVLRFNRDCDDTDLNWRLYALSCQLEPTHGYLHNVSWTLLNVTEAMHGDLWKVTQYHGEQDEEQLEDYEMSYGFDDPGYEYPAYTDTPMEVIHTPSTTIFVKGSITDTTVYVDEGNVMTVEALVTKLYPNVNELFHEITATRMVTNNTDQVPQVIDGEAKEDNTTRDDGLIPVVWKASTNMTDAEYNYTVSYSNIVLAQTLKGSFCIGTACPTPTSDSPKGFTGCWGIILLILITKI